MKEQYVGDISDYRKYALLRRLQKESGLRIGVCWMLTPGDGRSDGNKLSYLSQASFERHDPDLFRLLGTVMHDPDRRRLVLIEESGIIPAVIYFNTVVPDSLDARLAWFREAGAALASTDLIFFDPDNGVDIRSVRKGTRDSRKFVYRDEIATTYAAGHSVLVYQHFPREERGAFIARLEASLLELCPEAAAWLFRTAHVAFFLPMRPEHKDALVPAARAVSAFDPRFLMSVPLTHQLG